jgi:hypothetical protein
MAAPGERESVWDYPRPPRWELSSREIEVIFAGSASKPSLAASTAVGLPAISKDRSKAGRVRGAGSQRLLKNGSCTIQKGARGVAVTLDVC